MKIQPISPWLTSALPRWDRAGPNTTGCGTSAAECDNWQWLFEPRDRIQHASAREATGTVTLRWQYSGSGSCRYAVASSFPDSLDSGDTAASGGPIYSATISGSAGDDYRITCGTARVVGVVQ